MKLIVLGNEFVKRDSLAKEIADSIRELDFVHVKDSFELMEIVKEKERFIVLDVVEGLNEVKELTIDDLEVGGIVSAHDFDASFVFKLLKPDLKIIGIPMRGNLEKIMMDVRVFLSKFM